MVGTTAVLDSCVLYPAQLRSLFMYLAVGDLFRAKWTAEIHDEWIRNVLNDRPDLTLNQLQRTRQLMDAHVRDGVVVDYEHVISSLDLPDPKDRHVLAAAVQANADHIVTFNLSDFPADVLSKHGVSAVHPDEFVVSLIETDPDAVCEAAKLQRESLKNPAKTIDEYLAILERAGLVRTVAALRALAELL